MRRRASLLLLPLAVLVSCRSTDSTSTTKPADVRLFAESSETGGSDWVLPQSGVRIACAPTPVVATADVAGVGLATMDLGQGFLVELSPRGRELLAQRQATSPGRRLVLVVNNAAIGCVHLERPVLDGRIVFLVEVPELELPGLVESLKPAFGARARRFLAP